MQMNCESLSLCQAGRGHCSGTPSPSKGLKAEGTPGREAGDAEASLVPSLRIKQAGTEAAKAPDVLGEHAGASLVSHAASDAPGQGPVQRWGVSGWPGKRAARALLPSRASVFKNERELRDRRRLWGEATRGEHRRRGRGREKVTERAESP